METLKNLGLEQLKINFKWMKNLQPNLFKQIHKNEEEFELTRDIMTESLNYLNEKSRVIRVFNSFPDNFEIFVKEMNERSKINYFLENLLKKISQIIFFENKRRMKFVQTHADNIPVQVKYLKISLK